MVMWEAMRRMHDDPSFRAKHYGLARQMVGVAELGNAQAQLQRVRQVMQGCTCEACRLSISELVDVCGTILWAFENAGQLIGDKALEHIGAELRRAQQVNGSDTAKPV